MRRRLLVVLAICVSVTLAGCASVSTRVDETSALTPLPSQSEPPSPAHVEEIIIGLDSISHAHDGSVRVIPLADGGAILSLFQTLYGTLPDGTRAEVFPGYDSGSTFYRWREVTVSVSDQGPTTTVAILAPTVQGVQIRTQDGIAVGSTRSEALAAGARDGWDEDGDGVADHLELGSIEVPGTQSLSREGLVGSLHLLLIMEGDIVKAIQFPGNDFSDI